MNINKNYARRLLTRRSQRILSLIWQIRVEIRVFFSPVPPQGFTNTLLVQRGMIQIVLYRRLSLSYEFYRWTTRPECAVQSILFVFLKKTPHSPSTHTRTRSLHTQWKATCVRISNEFYRWMIRDSLYHSEYFIRVYMKNPHFHQHTIYAKERKMLYASRVYKGAQPGSLS